MRDRLQELNEKNQPPAGVGADPPADLEKGDGPAGAAADGAANMKDFFEEVSNVRAGIANIKKNVEEIERLHSKALESASEEHAAESSTELDQLTDGTSKLSMDMRNKLKEMDVKLKKQAAKDSNSSEQRIRQSQYAVLTKKFTEVMTEYNDIQNKYRNKYRQRLQRQYLIVKPDATQDEINKVMDGEGGPIFAQQMLPSGQHAEARKALQDIQDKHADIIKIEKSILELNQLFMDLAALVAQQGDMLNQIDHNVANAVEYTDKGVEEVKKAVKHQKRARKRMCALIFCLVILAVVIGVVVWLFTPKK